MLLLTQAADFLELQTANAVSTDWTCSWVDLNYAASGLVPGSTQGNVATPLSTKIAPAPPPGFQRQIKYLSVVNKDLTLTQTVVIDKNSGTAVNITGAVPLGPGETLQYVDSRGFFVLNAQGFEKFIGATGPAGTPGATGPPGFGPPGTDGDAGEDGVSIPGSLGAAGAPGQQGPFGYLMLIDGEQGEEGMHVPGPAGAQGPQGIPGSAGSGGASGFEILYQEITAEEQWPQGQNTPPASAAAPVTPALPGTIPDLVLWIETDNILGSAGQSVSRLQERTPWMGGVAAQAAVSVPGPNAVIDAVQLNSLNVLTWGNVGSALYNLQPGMRLAGGVTYFVVARGVSSAGAQAIAAGTSTGGPSLYMTNSGPNLSLVNEGVALIAACSTAWVVGTAFQANVTYNDTTGAWAFRQGRAAANSGTGATGVNGLINTVGGDQFASNLRASIAALIIYNRVLTAPEIASVEAYLLAKWGV